MRVSAVDVEHFLSIRLSPCVVAGRSSGLCATARWRLRTGTRCSIAQAQGGFCEGEGLASRSSCVEGALLAYGFTHVLQGFL